MENTPTSVLTTEPGDTEASGSGSTAQRWALAAALVALVAVMAFVAWNVLSTASGDGADSPEAAVEALVAAIEASDLEAAIDALVPGERDAARGVVGDALGEASRIGLLSSGIDMAAVPGFEFEVHDLSLTSTSAGDDVAAVHVRGTLITTIFGGELPLGPAVGGILPVGLAEIPSPPPTDVDLQLSTVRRDGRWYVSVGHTIAEVQRTENGWPVPDPNSMISPIGFSSPEAAAEALLERLSPLDSEGLIAMLNPGEAEAAHRYISNYRPIISEWEANNEFTVDDIEYRIEVDGDFADIKIDVLAMSTTITNSWDGSTYSSSVRFHEGCITIKDSHPDVDEDSSAPDPVLAPAVPGITHNDDGSVTVCPTDASPMGPLASGFLTGTYPPTVGLAQHQGQWYVSPVRTIANDILGTFRSVPDGEGARLFERLLTNEALSTMEYSSAPELVPPSSPTTTVAVGDISEE